MDGTFKTAPRLFLQLYVLHGPIGECTIPLVYAFLETKDQETYKELFTVIQRESLRRNHLFMPPVIHIDFELAVINAYRAVVGIHCCFFHLTQNTWKHIQQLGLVVSYMNDDNFKLFCGIMDGLAFLSLQDVYQGMVFLRQAIHPLAGALAEALAGPLLDYFDTTYVNGAIVNGRRIPPLFSPNLW